MRIALLGLLAAFSSVGQTIEAFGLEWSVPIASDWVVEDSFLHLLTPRPQEKPRRPKQFALAETPLWKKVTVSMEAKSPEGNFIVVYAWRDESHFNYAHFSVDEATKQPVHNGIFHVYGGDRVRISQEGGPAALSGKDVWHALELTYDADTGTVDVTINGKALPAFRAVDLSLGPGRIGVGSFFNTASFRNVKVTGER